MTLDVLLDPFWKELPPPLRIPRLAACGYTAMETWGGGDVGSLRELARAGADHGVELVSIVMNSATDAPVAPIRRECRTAFVERMERYSDNALEAGCHRGIVTTGQAVAGRSHPEQRASLVEALADAGRKLAPKGFTLNLEVLNTQVDHPGYFLDSPEAGLAIVREIASTNVRLLYDIYHMEIMRGNQVVLIENNIDWIGHFHAAGVPGRHEPQDGETNYPFVLRRIRDAGYDGYFGLEYFPSLDNDVSLRATREHLMPALAPPRRA